MFKKIIQWIVILIGTILIVNLSRDILRLIKAGEQIDLAVDNLAKAKTEYESFLKKKEIYTSGEFVEEEARNRLNMAKPDEVIAILPKNLDEILGRSDKKPESEITNWQKWWRLFFPAIIPPKAAPAG